RSPSPVPRPAATDAHGRQESLTAMIRGLVVIVILAFALSGTATSRNLAAQETTTTDVGTLDKESAARAFPSKPAYSPYAGRDFPTRPYFGDTHVHTSF